MGLNQIVIRVRWIMSKHWIQKLLHFCHIRLYFKSTKEEKSQFFFLVPTSSNKQLEQCPKLYSQFFLCFLILKNTIFPFYPKGLDVLALYRHTSHAKGLWFVHVFISDFMGKMWLNNHKIRFSLNLYFSSCSKRNMFLKL